MSIKSQFVITGSVRGALLVKRVDVAQVRNAVQAALNDVPQVDEACKLSPIKFKPGSEMRDSSLKFRENETRSYSGNGDSIPGQFAAYCDAETSIDKLFGQRELTLPACFVDWIGKFVKVEAHAAPVPA